MKYMILKKLISYPRFWREVYGIGGQVFEHVATYDTEKKAEEVLDQLGRDYMNSFGLVSPYHIEEYEEEDD